MRERVRAVSLTRLAGAGLRCLHPAITLILVRDRLGTRLPARASREHLDAVMQWLCRAQDSTGGRGVSAGYSLIDGWLPPYPETTGYIIPTFFDYAAVTGQEEFRARARRMADWEIELQFPSGAVQAGVYRGPESKRHPVVFNTGQVILGWCRAYREIREQSYLDAALRAGRWLVGIQQADGSWNLPALETETTTHAYDVRTAWSLLELYALTHESSFASAARAHLEWTLGQQLANGWFEQNAFFYSHTRWSWPLTHTIAYVLEGLLGAWRILGDECYLRAAYRTGERLLQIFDLHQYLPGEFDSSWKPVATYSCLTGDAQTAGVWLLLYQATRERRFLNAARALNDYVKRTQALASAHSGIRGGIKGSHPIFGRYTRFVYPNWAAKFFADSLMLEEQVMAPVEGVLTT